MGWVQMILACLKFLGMSQQHGTMQNRDESQNKGQGLEQNMLNPINQACMSYDLQAAAQQKSGHVYMMQQQQGKIGNLRPPSGNDQEMRMGNLKMQDQMSIQAASQARASSSRKSSEQYRHGEKQMEQLQQSTTSDTKTSHQVPGIGQMTTGNAVRPLQDHHGVQNIGNNPFAMAQLQAMHAWARDNNIDLSFPANANLISQVLPLLQSNVLALQKSNESSVAMQPSYQPTLKQQTISSPQVGSENSVHGNASSDVSRQSASAKVKQTVPTGPFTNTLKPSMANHIQMQQNAVRNRENQASRQPIANVNGMPPMHPPESHL